MWPRRWAGRWIWCREPTPSPTPFQVDVQARPADEIVLFRKRVALTAVPPNAPCRVTADGRYRLHVNGVEVGRGPVRGEPQQLRYDVHDLADHLREGENVIAAMVRHYGSPVPYWKPAPLVGMLGAGGLLLEARLGDALVVSDGSWRWRTAPYERHEPGWVGSPPVEILDGREFPWGWDEPDFDDSQWANATELIPAGLGIHRAEPPSDPFGSLVESELPPLFSRNLVVDTASSALAEGSWRTFDIGRLVNGHPILAMNADSGTLIELSCGEDLDESGHPVVAPRRWSLRYVACGRDGERVESFEPVGHRYIQVAVRTGQVRSYELSIDERHYPRPSGASFQSGDAFLDELWLAGGGTLDACSTDALMDCPGREQRAWLGDAYVQTLISLVCNPDTQLVRWNARLHNQGARSDGLRPMVAGADFTDIVTIPDFSLHWVRTITRLWDHLGDAELVEELLPRAVEALQWFERHRGSNGLLEELTGWVFVDWAQTERRAHIAAIDALYALALDDLATLADAIGDEGTARRSRTRSLCTKEAFAAYWDTDRGVFIDAADSDGQPCRRVSQHTNVLAMLCGAAAPADWPQILATITDDERLVMTRHPGDGGPLEQRLWYHWAEPEAYGGAHPFDEEQHVVLAQPFFTHFVHQAFAMAGRDDLLFASFDRWRPLLARGNGVIEEYWTHEPGQGSRCHAWSGTPTYDLTTHVLGVRPVEPGYRTVTIEPHLGPLTRVEGTVPTPHGLIRARFERDSAGKVTADVELPPGVSSPQFKSAQ